MADYSLIDLHTHTTHSQEGGWNDKVEVVLEEAQKIAERSGKDALIAITDHNTISGVQEAHALLRSGRFPNVKLVNGCEFTVNLDELNSQFGGRVFGNCHILAYGFDPFDPGLTEYSRRSGGVSGGKMSFRKLSELVGNAGGKLVIAHPGLIKVFPKGLANYRGSEYNEELLSIAESGRSSKTILRYVPNGKYILELFSKKLNEISGGLVVGMESFHPDNYTHGFDKEIEKICKKQGLIQTAGSDFHGYNLHTEFSVGNPFTERFQEFYKKTLEDSQEFRNGLHVSYLPGIEILSNENPSNDKEIRMITAKGETVSYDQYNVVNDALVEQIKRQKSENSPSRYQETPKKGNNNNNNHNNHRKNKKNKKHGKHHHGKKKSHVKYYETNQSNQEQSEFEEQNQFDGNGFAS